MFKGRSPRSSAHCAWSRFFMFRCLQPICCPARSRCPPGVAEWRWQTSTREVRRTFTVTQGSRFVAKKWPPASMRRCHAGVRQDRNASVSIVGTMWCQYVIFVFRFIYLCLFFQPCLAEGGSATQRWAGYCPHLPRLLATTAMEVTSAATG